MSSDMSLSGGSSRKTSKLCGGRWLIFWAVLTAAACIGLGVIIGYFSHSSSSEPNCSGATDPTTPIIPTANPNVTTPNPPSTSTPICPGSGDPGYDACITGKILEQINADNIRENLRNYTLYPHMAGTSGEEMLADELMEQWRRQGLDYVTSVTYDVLLSYPNTSDPNMIYLVDENGVEQHKTQEVEAIVRDDQNHTDVIPPFNAYSPPGDVEGDLVYVNYGRVEDFKLLVSNYSVNVTGKIVIARYGRIFRGDKVANAEKFGAIGVIIYSDPADYTIADNDEEPYPQSWWLPGTGVQRGTIESNSDGDPLTPGYPATETAYRRAEEDAELPTIPCHPIGYDDAQQFLSRLGGDEVPEDWRGRLNITYRFGPGFDGAAQNWTVKMHVSTHNKRVNTSDLFAYIRGAVEPDRYVLLGNHRDAWVFGAIDPTSSTALMMEVSRVFANLVKEGWRPRRTIIFCSWGAEEHGLVGSYEWVEEHIKNLGSRAIAYLNVDLSVEGQVSMRGKGVPLLYDLLYDVAKKIPAANNQSITLYDEWLNTFPQKDTSLPVIQSLGSGSDHAAFIGIAGVPCIDVRYTHNYPIIDYPLYHSVYETFHLFDEILDPDYKYSRAIGQYWAEAARYLADSALIPFNASQYGETFSVFVTDLKEGYGELMESNNVSLAGLEKAAEDFKSASDTFMQSLQNASLTNPLEVRMLNDQLMQLERAFITSEGLPGRPYHKHILFAPSAFDSYAGVTFPGLVDLMWEIEDRVGEDADRQWDLVRQHLAAVIYSVDSATSTLKPVTEFN